MGIGLYVTADGIAQETGGGQVTQNELLALEAISSKVAVVAGLDIHPPAHKLPATPFLEDMLAQAAVRKILERESKEALHEISTLFERHPITMAHFYAGSFTQTVRTLKRSGVKISFTSAAHDIEISKQEFAYLDFAFDYPHLINPDLRDEYLGGCREADIAIAPSKRSHDILKSYGCSKVVIIPHGVNLPREVVSPNPTFQVGYLGQIGPDKGLAYLLEAWKQLRYPDARLVIAGRYLEGIHHFVRRFGGGNIQVLGEIEKVPDLYNAVTCYVQPSVNEGFGLEVLEAMAHGRPVIVSTGAGACDVVTDGKDGFVVPSRSPEIIAEKIEWFRSHPEETRAMGVAARETAKQYSWEKIRSKYQETWANELLFTL